MAKAVDGVFTDFPGVAARALTVAVLVSRDGQARTRAPGLRAIRARRRFFPRRVVAAPRFESRTVADETEAVAVAVSVAVARCYQSI
jgi:hypothetical protein